MTKTTESSASPPSVTAFAARLASQRWLEPDTDFATLSQVARGEIAARFDEHLSALFALPSGARLPEAHAPRLWLTDSRAPAAARWLADARPSFWPGRRKQPPPWDAACHAARGVARAALDARFDPPAAELHLAAITREVLGAVESAAANSPSFRAIQPPPATQRPGQRENSIFALPPLVAAQLHGLWLAAFDPLGDCRGAPPSPWLPLLNLWERGAWPFASGDDELCVVACPAERSAGEMLRREQLVDFARATSVVGFAPPLYGFHVARAVIGPLPPPDLPT